jgi:hypothetical protein
MFPILLTHDVPKEEEFVGVNIQLVYTEEIKVMQNMNRKICLEE